MTRINTQTWRQAAMLAVLACTLVALVGCGKPAITADYVRGNMSPELETLSRSHEQRLNRNARSVDTTKRQIHDDWDNLWLTKDPLRLSEYSIP